jgi:copper resistance protein D
MDDALIYARGVHFAATLSVAGAVFFAVFVAEPAFRAADGRTRLPEILRSRLRWIAWVVLVLTIISGAVWLLAVAQSMSGSALVEVFSGDVLGTVLLQTGFGRDWLCRLALACLLGLTLAPALSARKVGTAPFKAAAVALAAGLAGSLVWAGHAAGGEGIEGIVHPAADFLHLVAAAAWAGTLLPLALLFVAAVGGDAVSVAIARIATVRFSNFGIASVATLLVTGSINTWYLAGSVAALTRTDYGHLLLIKIALFLIMVAVAAVNRLVLTPRLVHDAGPVATTAALRLLRRNTVIEVILGAAIIAVVAALGTNPPGFEALMHPQHHH